MTAYGQTFDSRRSAVLTEHGSVSSDQPLASQIGLDILRKGGNAADAAVAIAAALGLTIPHSTGIGGDCFCLFYKKSENKVYGLNGSGRSPAALTLDLVKSHGYSEDNPVPTTSGLAVSVPGAAAGWIDTVELFGSGKELFEPTIKLAEEGFPVAKVNSLIWKIAVQKLSQTRYGSELLIDGRAPEEGEIFRNPYFAKTLRIVADKGKEGFYRGEIAQKIVEEVQHAGGCMTLEDLQDHIAPSTEALVEPLSVEYNGVRLWEIPPNSQGIIALMALNFLKGFDLKEMGHNSAQYVHTLAEMLRLAFADGLFYVADIDHMPVSLDSLLSEDYAEKRRKLFDPDKATLAGVPHGNPLGHHGTDTTYFTVVDAEGNACSFINSVYMAFGTGLVPKGFGFSLQNRALTFRMDPDHPNAYGPRKKPYQTIIPAMITDDKDGSLKASYGVMGGYNQPQGHIQVFLNMVVFGMDPQQALDQPRIRVDSSNKLGDAKYVFDLLATENGIPPSVIQELEAKGHNVRSNVTDLLQRNYFGRGHVITEGPWWRQEPIVMPQERVLWTGSDPRSDGVAYGY